MQCSHLFNIYIYIFQFILPFIYNRTTAGCTTALDSVKGAILQTKKAVPINLSSSPTVFPGQEKHPTTTTARLVSVFKNLGLTSDMKQVDVKVPGNRRKIRQLVTNFKAEITDLETANEMRDFFSTKIIPGYTDVEWDAIDSVQNILTYGWVAFKSI